MAPRVMGGVQCEQLMLCDLLAIVVQCGEGQVLGRGAATYGLLPSSILGRCEQDPETWITVRINKHQRLMLHTAHCECLSMLTGR